MALNGARRFLRAALLGAVAAWALGACTRASAPAPAAETVAPPPPSATPAKVEVQTAPTSSLQAAPSSATAVASAAVAASSSRSTAKDCSRFNTSPEYRDLTADERARLLATCQAKEEFRSFVAARQSCSNASQCTVVAGSCPFGCFVPVAKAAAPEVVAKLEALGARLDKAGNRCVYRCMSPPSETCVAGQCGVATP